MKRFKDILSAVLNIYSYISLFIHELSHIVVLFLVGAKISRVVIDRKSKLGLEVSIETKSDLSKFKTFLVSFSPIFALVLIGVLAIFSKFFFVLFIYSLTNLRKGFALPSSKDFLAYTCYSSKSVDEVEEVSFELGEELYIV